MSIEEHKWSDSDVLYSKKSEEELLMSIAEETPRIFINKQDAIVIANHFNVGQEQLVNKIKALIEDDSFIEGFGTEGVVYISDLQSLINTIEEG